MEKVVPSSKSEKSGVARLENSVVGVSRIENKQIEKIQF